MIGALADDRRQRRVRRAALTLAVLLVLPSIGSGFFADDYLQIAQIEGWSVNPAGPLDLYSFVPRDRAAVARLRRDGTLPYFAAPRLQIAFLRPLSSALLTLDHALFGRRAVGYHVHTLLWYVAFLAAAVAVIRRVLPPDLATLALVMFCLDGGHAMAACWTAARNATVACALVFAAFLAQRRWRDDGWRPGAWLAPAAAALGLAAGEMALGALAYLLAWEVTAPPPRRARHVAPIAAVIAAYLVVYRVIGAGAHGSGTYLDPFGDPAGFLRALPARALLLVGSAVVAAPLDFLAADHRLRAPLLIAGAAAAAVVAAWLPRALGRMTADEARAVRGLGWGAAGALLVGTPALPGDRVLLAASLGAAVVLAALLRDAWRGLRARRARALALAGMAFVAVPNVVLAPIAFAGKVILLGDLFRDSRRLARDADIAAPVPARVIVLALADLLPFDLQAIRLFERGVTPDGAAAIVAARARGGAGLPLPDWLGYRGLTVLSLSESPVVLRRTAADSFELAAPDGTLLDGTWAETLRAPWLALPRGSTFDDGVMTTAVRDDRDGRPTRIAFRFDRPLDDPSLIFLALIDGRLRRFPMPSVGGEASVLPLRPLPGRAR